jgi:hypothetical protein
MPIAFYLDENVDGAIATELRKRGVDVITAQEDGSGGLRDDRLLTRASQLNRVLFTYDIRFKAMGEDWIRQAKPFGGLIWAHPLRIGIGQSSVILSLQRRRRTRKIGPTLSTGFHCDPESRRLWLVSF